MFFLFPRQMHHGEFTSLQCCYAVPLGVIALDILPCRVSMLSYLQSVCRTNISLIMIDQIFKNICDKFKKLDNCNL